MLFRSNIRLRLWRERRQKALEELVSRLRRSRGVEPSYELLRQIQLDPSPREDAEPRGPEPAGATANGPEESAAEPSAGD